MATLILSTVGFVVAGPVGALIGSVAGSFVDRQVLGALTPPVRREGPRLSDLAVQASTYGAPIPLVYGRARVAGNVLWSSGLQETRSTETTRVGGKGGQKVSTTSYSYSVSMAVGLSARSILRVERIWADGKLIREGQGPLSVGGSLRVYAGDGRQMPDPLLEAALGIDATPAWRGMAYAVIEDLQLAEFANRAPNLTFEVIADTESEIPVRRVLADVNARSAVGAERIDVDATVPGLVASRGVANGLDMLEVLRAATGVRGYATALGGLVYSDRIDDAAVTLDADLLGTDAPDQREAPPARRATERTADASLPREVALLYWDTARDYQPGQQRARRAMGGAATAERYELPLVLGADGAKATAERLLARRWRARRMLTVHLPWSALALEPGDTIAFAETPGARWRIETLTIDAGSLELELTPIDAVDRLSNARGDAGDSPRQASADHGGTTAHALDLPPLGATAPTSAPVTFAAGGDRPGWRRSSLYVSRDGGADYAFAAEIVGATVLGTTSNTLPPGPSQVWDERGSCDIALLNPSMLLEDRSATSVLAGANLCLIGDELVQFRTASLVVPGVYRLRGLLRGRRGTEWATTGHGPNERFVLLSGAVLAPVDIAGLGVGQSLLIKALSPYQALGDVPAIAFTQRANALRPLSPVHLTAFWQPGGDIALRWVRRSRAGFDWVDGVDAPLAEESEQYRIEILDSIGAVRRVLQTSVPEALYSMAQQTADFGAPVATLAMSIAQLSATVGPGTPARQNFTRP